MAKKQTKKRKIRVKVVKVIPEESKVVLEVHDAPVEEIPEEVYEHVEEQEPIPVEDASHPVVQWLKKIF
jgi:hypothetical protein